VWVVPSRGAVQVPNMLRGSVVTHRRRCGKPNCRCADGEVLHERVVLSYSEASRTRFVTLPEETIEPVRRARERYRRARARLEREANAGLAVLVSRLGPS
jgi:Family of unknown function (DUF6788)